MENPDIEMEFERNKAGLVTKVSYKVSKASDHRPQEFLELMNSMFSGHWEVIGELIAQFKND